MEDNTNVKTEQEKFRKTFRILGDVLFIPFFVIVLVASVLMYKAKINNEVPSLFGYSAVKILSGSMEPNYHEGQVVMVKMVDTSTLKIGDVIAFYDYMDPDTDTGDLVENMSFQTFNLQTNIGTFLGAGANENQKKVAPYSKVILHRIENISTPSNPNDENYGKLFFQTKGDSNSTVDEHWIMEDYVVGILSSDNSIVGNFFNFCTSTAGIIILIILPCVALATILTINLINEIKKYKEEELENNNVDNLPKDANSQDTLEKEKVLLDCENKKEEELVKNLDNKSKQQENNKEEKVKKEKPNNKRTSSQKAQINGIDIKINTKDNSISIKVPPNNAKKLPPKINSSQGKSTTQNKKLLPPKK